jgi:hypothetical protein
LDCGIWAAAVAARSKKVGVKKIESIIFLRVKVSSAVGSEFELQTSVLKSTEEISKVQILPAPGRFYRKNGMGA